MISMEFVLLVGTCIMMGLALYSANKLSSYRIDLQLHRVKEDDTTEENQHRFLLEKDFGHERKRISKKISG